jgi:MIP family channel proteins
VRAAFAEFLGTFLLVYAGCGAIMSDALRGGLGTVGIALVFGFVVLAMVAALGHVSGAHINPAVTLAFAATGHFPRRRALAYVGAQVLGAVAAALVLRVSLGDVASLGATRLSVPMQAGFVVEFMATFLLMLVVMAAATDPRARAGLAPLAIGGAVLLDALFAGPLTMASMNPARSLGPALVSGQLADLWLYLLAPVLGALAAAFAYEQLRPAHAPEPVLGTAGPVPEVEA